MSLTIGSAISSGQAGLDVAARRAASASSNVVNLRSSDSGFRPLELQQLSDAQNTPKAVVRPADGGLFANALPPETGIDLASETGTLITAQRAFEASLATISTADKKLGSLFDEEA